MTIKGEEGNVAMEEDRAWGAAGKRNKEEHRRKWKAREKG